ncbi:HNH endonuclease [Alcaligenes faecalis]|nr:HNH endonuclease [Alcaligenes faecalis]
MKNLTQAMVHEHLSYDSETGLFIRLKSGWKSRIGKIAGIKDSYGYLQIKIDGRRYLAHRLAWLYVHGEWPEKAIDHRNGVRDDNRIVNLRLANSLENGQNQFKAQSDNGRSGLLGVTFDSRREKWVAQIQIEGKNKNLGGFKDPETAHAAYLKAKAELHPFSELAASHRGKEAV